MPDGTDHVRLDGSSSRLNHGGGSGGGTAMHHSSVTIGTGDTTGHAFGGSVSRLNLSTGLLESGVGDDGAAMSLLHSGAYGMGVGGVPAVNAALSAAAGVGLSGGGGGEEAGGHGFGGRMELPVIGGGGAEGERVWGRNVEGGESVPLTRGHVDSSSSNV